MKTIFNNKYSKTFLSIFGGILLGVSYKYVFFALGWVCLIPLFIVLKNEGLKNSLKYTTVFGVTAAFILFAWMHDLVQTYSDSDTYLGLLLILISAIYFTFWVVLFGIIYSKTIAPLKKTSLKVLSTAALWVIIEWTNTQLLSGIPWLGYTVGHTQTTNIYMIQTASFGGVWIISFTMVIINYLFYKAIALKTYKPAILSVLIIVILHGLGWAMVHFNTPNHRSKSLKVAIINENIPSTTKWQGKTTDSIANIFSDLNKEAILEKPELIVWSETAIPWIFNDEDRFLEHILQATYPIQANHLMGITIPNEKDTSSNYNAACYIRPDGAITARSEKEELLKVLERPFINLNWKIPFLSEGMINSLSIGDHTKTLITPSGKIGVLICNESLFPYISRRKCLNKAQYLVLMANNGWFNGNSLIKQHLYTTRLRAVENRRDIILNCNMGYSGKISANGEISSNFNYEHPQVINEKVIQNKDLTFYTQFGDLFIFALLIIFIFITKTHLNLKK